MLFQRVALVALTLLGCSTLGVSAQAKGVYFRPTGDQVTGNPNPRVANHRSPCPAMNSLANHGFINRNGKNLTPGELRRVMKDVLNIDQSIADFLTQDLPSRLTLADMSRHNFIEHDASLVRADVFFGIDPVHVDGGLANDLMARMDANRRLGIQELGEALRVRLIWCQQKAVGCDFGRSQRDITFGEAAKILLIFGSRSDDEKISVEQLFSFMVEERFPDDWQKPRRAVSLREMDAMSLRIQRVAGVASN